MTRILLEVPQEKDVALLMALLKRLNIRVIQPVPADEQMSASTEDQAFILNGLPEREDLEEFLREFELSRTDRPVSGPEN